MANSKMLKEAIADAKAVRETAIANAKIALEEAFTPQLQSLLSKKLQSEMEGEDEEDYEDEEAIDEKLGSSEIGKGSADNPEDPASVANTATTDLSGIDKETSDVGSEDENLDVVKEDLEEGDYEDDEEDMYEDEDYDDDGHEEVPTDVADELDDLEDDMEDEEDLDLESVIAELESELAEQEDEPEMDDMDFDDEDMEEGLEDAVGYDDPTNADDAELDIDKFDLDEGDYEDDDEMDEMVDLEEILREMGYGDDEDDMDEASYDDEEDHMDEKSHDYEEELEEAYATIKELRGTINEVNLLNAKLLYANKLFKGYSLTNEQKTKVVENLDRTSSVREVKLVYATLAESMNFTGTDRKKTRRISESISSTRPSKSTAPKKEMITESSNELADRFKKLAGINKGNN